MSPIIKSKPSTATKSSNTKNGDMPLSDKLLAATRRIQDTEGVEPPPLRQKVSLVAGYPDVKVSTVAGAFSKLKKQKLVEYPDDKTVQLTQAGYDKAESLMDSLIMDCSKGNEAALERFKSQCKSLKGVQILEVLSDGRAQDRTIVANLVGFTDVKSSTFAGALSNLRKMGALEYIKDQSKNMVKLTDAVFPFGRPKQNEIV